MAEMMGGSEEAQAQRLECQKQMEEGGYMCCCMCFKRVPTCGQPAGWQPLCQKQMDEGGCCAACMHIYIC